MKNQKFKSFVDNFKDNLSNNLMDVGNFFHVYKEMDKNILLKSIQESWINIRHATPRQRKDPEIISLAVKINVEAFNYADDILRNDKKFILSLLDINPKVFPFVPIELREDIDIVTKALSFDGFFLRHAAQSLTKNFEIVKKAILQNGLAIQFADYELRQNCDLGRLAIKKNPKALFFLWGKLKYDREMILTVYSQTNSIGDSNFSSTKLYREIEDFRAEHRLDSNQEACQLMLEKQLNITHNKTRKKSIL